MKRYLHAAKSAIGIRRFVVGSSISLAVTGYGALRQFLPQLPDLPYWFIATVLFLLFVSWWFLAHIVELQDTLTPRIAIEYRTGPPFEVTYPRRFTDGSAPVVRAIRIKVCNNGSTLIEGCLVKLNEMRALDGRDFYAGYLPIGMRTQHQTGEQRTGGPFDLRPGEFKFVEVAILDESSPSTEILLAYETDRYPNMIPRGEYELLIGAYGASAPTLNKFRLWVNNGRLAFSHSST